MDRYILAAAIFVVSVLNLHGQPAPPPQDSWRSIERFFQPPGEFAGKLGTYRSPLVFDDGKPVPSAADWAKRRKEISDAWTALMGPWPNIIAKPKIEVLSQAQAEGYTKERVRVEIGPGQTGEGWLLTPDGRGPFPAALVVYYEPETSVGMNAKQPQRDFALQLTKRGFVTLSIGTPGGDARKPELGKAVCQPLSYHAYVAANCWHALANRPNVDATRIGVVGHSYGGKWAMFAAALWEKFAAVAVSDPGIVFDEKRSNVNYWEPWYLGLDPEHPRPKAGIPSATNPRTGAYKKMIEAERDLHEIHALIAPRPFLVSGGSEDPPERWIALNHTLAVNKLLGHTQRVAMTNRTGHTPTEESNAQLYAFFEHFLGNRTLRGEVIDAAAGRPVAARIYIQGEDGRWHHVHSAYPAGSAVPYDKRRPEPNCVEIHTTVSAHPFVAELPAGKYTITVERGKEYHPHVQTLTIGAEPAKVRIPLTRWIDMAARGWYSGDTHVHRTLAETPNLVASEDINVAFPLLHWVQDAFTSPAKRNLVREEDPGRLITVDPTHVIWPRNTEYEIFAVGKQRHTLGAFFVINHRTPFTQGVPPVTPVARKAKSEGALIEMDKHNWPWSMALAAAMPIDLFELSNNHVWRTEFAFRGYGEQPAEYMKIERDAKGWTEWGWIDFGFQNYYALLDCGLRLRPTAGTASGVHPVPLGFGRLYVQITDGFNYERWLQGLNQGRSFATTGPMLFVQLNGQPPGHIFKSAAAGKYRLTGSAVSAVPLSRIEVVVNGSVERTIKPENRKTKESAIESMLDERIPIDSSSWVAVRCLEDRPDKRVRFAHTGPIHIEIDGKPLSPRKVEVDYLIARVRKEIDRSADLIPKDALDEYTKALRYYHRIAIALNKGP